jgi:predicted PurR-regulated permease PerM
MVSNQLSHGVKYAIILIGLVTLFFILYIAQSILVPIILSFLIAVLFSPIVVFFSKLRIPKVISITLTMILVSCFTVVLLFILTSQLSIFSESFPSLLENFYLALEQFIDWLAVKMDVKPSYLNNMVTNSKAELMEWGKSSISATLSTIGYVLVMLFLIPVYVFMILYYKPLLHEFLFRLIGKGNELKLNSILISIKSIVQRYLVALILEMAIMTALNTGALMIIGVEYAFILGLIGAILNVIPYIGGVVSTALPMIVALGSGNPPSMALLVLASYIFIQFVDNNYIIPKLVGAKVKINALASIVVVLIGGALWGVTGMFLSIPLIAIIKIIFDHIDSLKPWGYLLGDTMPPIIKLRFNFMKKTKLPSEG